jgi:hypothetical protein
VEDLHSKTTRRVRKVWPIPRVAIRFMEVVGQSVKDGVHLIGRVGCDTDTDKGSTASNEWRQHHFRVAMISAGTIGY